MPICYMQVAGYFHPPPVVERDSFQRKAGQSGFIVIHTQNQAASSYILLPPETISVSRKGIDGNPCTVNIYFPSNRESPTGI